MEESLPRDLTAASQHLEQATVRIEDQLIERLKADGSRAAAAACLEVRDTFTRLCEQLDQRAGPSGRRSSGCRQLFSSALASQFSMGLLNHPAESTCFSTSA
jgi:hypothetical protein